MLYAACHANPSRIRHPDRPLSLFSDLATDVASDIGGFVKRLSLVWSGDNEGKNYKIIGQCLNMFIFSSLQRHYEGGRSWWGQGLPKTIHSFDADVCSIPVNDILSSLEMLPQLELIHLETLTATGCLIPCAPMCWTALLILSIYSCIFNFMISFSPPVSPAIQLPGLTSLATDQISVHARLSFLSMHCGDWNTSKFCVRRVLSGINLTTLLPGNPHRRG